MQDNLPSTKPYFIRAWYEWCCDNGFTPHISVEVDDYTVVPREYVRDGQIVLNIGPEATGRMLIDNEAVQFSARFGGVARELWVPIARVAAVYARENSAGMAFEVEETPPSPSPANASASSDGAAAKSDAPPVKARPKLQRIK